MDLPFQYDHIEPLAFGGALPVRRSFDDSPRRHPAGAGRSHDLVRRRHAQRSARDPAGLVAHGAVGRGDAGRRARRRHLHAAGDGASRSARWSRSSTRSSASRTRSSAATSSSSTLGGEHSITPPLVSAAARKYPGAVGAADRRARRSARVLHGHAAQPRLRHAPRARVRAASRRWASAASRPRKPRSCPRLNTTIFYDVKMREDPAWIDARRRVARARRLHHHRRGRPRSGDHAGDRHAGAGRAVLDGGHAGCCGRPPSSGASSPATSWSSSPIPGMVAPNFLCAKLIYKLSHLLLRERPAVATRWGLTPIGLGARKMGSDPRSRNWCGYRDLT